mmetsp:Transcript_12555/g.18817  ORF Transcript_12555/g.18817 Transcript_12555/m.18817 type:complete len:82 (-) Transcript_12555:398-643(-)
MSHLFCLLVVLFCDVYELSDDRKKERSIATATCSTQLREISRPPFQLEPIHMLLQNSPRMTTQQFISILYSSNARLINGIK